MANPSKQLKDSADRYTESLGEESRAYVELRSAQEKYDQTRAKAQIALRDFNEAMKAEDKK